MSSTFALDVIKSLQPSEISAFRLFLGSAYSSQGFNATAIQPFFELLVQTLQAGKMESLEKEDISSRLYPGKSFIESKIDKLMSDLKRLLERFLLTQRYFSEQNEAYQLLDLSAELRQRGLESRYFQVLDRVKKHELAGPRESIKSLFYRYLLATEEQEWYSTFNRGKGALNIPETIARLEAHFFAHKTWMLNHLDFMQMASSLPAEVENLENHTHYAIPEDLLQQSAFLSVCWQVRQLLKSGNTQVSDFQTLLEKIRQQEHALNPESLAEVYTYARNFCVLLIDAGNLQLYPVMQEINRDNLKRGYFYLDGKIPPNACLNITQTSLYAGEIAWADQFIEEHKDRIINETEEREFYRMNKAICLFGDKKYEEALDLIPFGSSYSYYHHTARRLEVKIYYELHSELLDHKLDAFKMYVSRAEQKGFPARVKELYTNFGNFVRQLSQSTGPKAKQRSEVLLKRIAEKKVVAERIWLLEKARELGEKKR